MTEQPVAPVRVNIDRIRAGQVVLVDNRRHYAVTRFRMSEDGRITRTGYEATGPTTIEVELQPYWQALLPSEAPFVEALATLSTERVVCGGVFVIDGCAYQVMTIGTERDPGQPGGKALADCALITLRLLRVWWNDAPKEPA